MPDEPAPSSLARAGGPLRASLSAGGSSSPNDRENRSWDSGSHSEDAGVADGPAGAGIDSVQGDFFGDSRWIVASVTNLKARGLTLTEHSFLFDFSGVSCIFLFLSTTSGGLVELVMGEDACSCKLISLQSLAVGVSE